MKVTATLTVNGTRYPVELDPHVSLLNAVRNEIGLTGSKEGCDDSECGACMMLLDGKPVNSCSYLALQAEGKEITTVEGLAGDDEVGPLQRAFLQQFGVQCGFCTPGMLNLATALLRMNPDPTDEEDPDRPVRQPVPLHGLRRHRKGRAAGFIGRCPRHDRRADPRGYAAAASRRLTRPPACLRTCVRVASGRPDV